MLTGYTVFWVDTLISWKSKKHEIVSHSSTELEYHALGTISCEIIWILMVRFDLGINDLIHVPIFYDNESTNKLVLNPVFP